MTEICTRPHLDAQTQRLEGKVAIVTGGTTRIGRATAKLLAQSGVTVVIYGRAQRDLDDAVEDIQRAGGEVFGLAADNAYEDQILRVFDETQSRFGDIDILINNAALPAKSLLEDYSYDDALYIMRVNILGYLTCIREAVKMMKRKGMGHIVNMGSMSAKVREPGADIYVATKGAIEAMSESLRKCLGSDNIRISLIEPGLTGTNLHGEPADVEGQRRKEEDQEMMTAEDIALVIYDTLVLPPRANIVELRISPTKQAI